LGTRAVPSGRHVALTLVVVLVAVLAAPSPADAYSTESRIMGSTEVAADDLWNWYRSTGIRPHADLGITIRSLARIFIEEGRAEGVRGDIAFAQSVLETDYFRFPSSGQVRPRHNNYGGIGAVDGGSSPDEFPRPRIGVRAQIQHLRAYADRTVTESNLAYPLVDPRFHFVSPKGRAPRWLDLSGTWASDTSYGHKILTIFGRILIASPPRPGAIPVSGDWNGDGITNLGWFQEGQWVLLQTDGSRVAFKYGTQSGDVPVVGNWDGVGGDGVGIFRRGGEWHLRNGFSGRTNHIFTYGQKSGDVPVVGDWDGVGGDGVGIFRRGGEWHLRNGFSGRTNEIVRF
jgi:hypothetical protein